MIQAENPHVRFVNLDDHGYSILNVTPDGVQMDWHAISDRRDPEARSRLLTSWSVASGTSYVAPVHGASPA